MPQFGPVVAVTKDAVLCRRNLALNMAGRDAYGKPCRVESANWTETPK
jgi:hypothetical protein